MASEQSVTTKTPALPSWIEASLFEPVLKEIAADYKQTKNFAANPALNAGENYATVMLRIEAEVELNAILTTLTVMGVVLCDPTNSASIDNFVGDSEGSQEFKALLYSNDRFLKHLEVILPWLYYRGAFEM